ncbi:vWA domain-containing protein [Paenibacillus koleovorans]|uniref:vWA domain-containing protein n=1 Tax=Paenibacillus koleovorans TaxID=121608 RepID=UPI000FDC7E5F|nr:vWA domain-containing protein [Paenibacillus koleovorans]
MRREWNVFLLVGSLAGGFLGFVAGEWLLRAYEGSWHETLLMGVYFGILAFATASFCLLAEIISPDLNGASWRHRYLRDALKWTIPASLILLFVAGAVLQFIYGLSFGQDRGPARDYALAIDISGSMNTTDPNRRSMQAAQGLIGRMDTDKRVSVVLFNQAPQLLQPLVQLSDEEIRGKVTAVLKTPVNPDGGTDIGQALTFTGEHLKDRRESDRRSAVILISDGFSQMDMGTVLAPYRDEKIEVHTVGMMVDGNEGTELLKQIANKTGGRFYPVANADQLVDVFMAIYSDDQARHLVGERTGYDVESAFYASMRTLFISIIGLLMGLSLGIIFDNKHLAKRFMIGGAVVGLAAGLVLEIGLRVTVEPALYRGIADILLAVVMTLSTVVVPVPRPSAAPTWDSSRSREGRSAERFGQGKKSDQTYNHFK